MNTETLYTRSGALEILGETLLHAQDFERSLGYCIGLVFSGHRKIGLTELTKIENDSSKITLGQFIDRIKRSHSVCDDIENKLKSALDGRNKMAHRLVDDPQFDLDTEAGCRRLVVFLIKLRVIMVELNQIFTSIQFTFLEDMGVSTISQLKHQQPEIFKFFASLDYQLSHIEDVG